jgi:hypothetical protein
MQTASWTGQWLMMVKAWISGPPTRRWKCSAVSNLKISKKKPEGTARIVLYHLLGAVLWHISVSIPHMLRIIIAARSNLAPPRHKSESATTSQLALNFVLRDHKHTSKFYMCQEVWRRCEDLWLYLTLWISTTHLSVTVNRIVIHLSTMLALLWM